MATQGIQFGLGIIKIDTQKVGYLQDGSIDLAFDKATLYSGGWTFPADVRYHSGTISGSATFAKVTAWAFEKLVGGTRTGTTVLLTNKSTPGFFSLDFALTTDAETFQVTLHQCTAGNVSWSEARDGYVTPSFKFDAMVDQTRTDPATGDYLIATIRTGTLS